MKTIYYKDFDKRGILIDVEDEYVYQMGHLREAINIPYEKLLYNKDQLLDKNKKYYIYCHGGVKSRRACNILEAYHFDVTQLLK